MEDKQTYSKDKRKIDRHKDIFRIMWKTSRHKDK